MIGNPLHLATNVACMEPDCRTYRVEPHVRIRTKYGIGCMGNVPPGSSINPKPPPQSYRLTDIGRPGFPALTPAEATLTKRVAHFVRSKTLRIAWLGIDEEFIVFDAVDGPCAGAYNVLNGGCNEMYQPIENPYHTIAAPGTGGCFPKRHPWR